MKLVEDLLPELEKFSPELITKENAGLFFSRVKEIKTDTAFHENILYIGRESQVQNTIQFLSGRLLFLIKDMKDFSFPAINNNCIVLFPKETVLSDLVKSCNHLSDECNALFEGSYLLLTNFIKKTDLADIVGTAAELIQNPLIVLDISFKVLAYSRTQYVDDEQWQKNIARGYCSYEYIAGFNNIEGVKKSPDSHEPFCIDCFTSPLRRCITKLYLGKVQVGFLIAIEANAPFENMNTAFFRLIGDLIAKVVNVEHQLAQDKSLRVFDSILIDSIEGTFKSRMIFSERMSQTDFNLHSEYVLMIVDIEKYNDYDYDSEHLREHISEMFPNSWPICYKNNIVVLVDLKQIKNEIGVSLAENQSYFEQNNLRVGVSDCFSDLFLIKDFYAQAKTALYISAHINKVSLFAFYDEYKFYALILSCEEKEKFQNYYCYDFIRIMQYDQKYQTQYGETVFAYLLCDKKLNPTAQRLYVHKNTVSYRIAKAKELFNIDFCNQEACFRLYYSFLLSKLAGSGLI